MRIYVAITADEIVGPFVSHAQADAYIALRKEQHEVDAWADDLAREYDRAVEVERVVREGRASYYPPFS